MSTTKDIEMTTIFATDPINSGEILHPNLVDTYVLDVGERTRNLSAYARSLPPVWGLRRSDATGEHPVYRPLTIGVVEPYALQEPPIGPVPPLPPPPPRVPVSTVYGAQERPDNYRSRHRAPRPVWAWRALHIGLGSVCTVALELAGIAALVVLR
jgi:hypothetical protein